MTHVPDAELTGDRAVQLTLYVSGRGARSADAVTVGERLDALLAPVGGCCEIVDVSARPERARADQILATPTLVRRDRGDVVRIVGDISDMGRLLDRLQLPAPLDSGSVVRARRTT